MYAHQAIEDLTNEIESQCFSDNSYQYYMQLIVDKIRQTQCFHLGSYYDIRRLTKQSHKRQLFSGELAKDVMLPYNNCWFDFTVEDLSGEPLPEDNFLSTKKGVLATSLTDELLWVFILLYVNDLRSWFLSPISFFISIGVNIKTAICNEKLKNEKILTHFIKSRFENLMYHNVYPVLLCDDLSRFFPKNDLPDNTNYTNLLYSLNDEISTLNSALMLLNCKNIGTSKIAPPTRLNKKRKKKNKHPLFSYHTLVVKPTNQNKNSIPKHLWQNSIHLRRGHFKTYTEGNPLFGKYTGRYWWQPHIAGTNKESIVMKDYELEPPDMEA